VVIHCRDDGIDSLAGRYARGPPMVKVCRLTSLTPVSNPPKLLVLRVVVASSDDVACNVDASETIGAAPVLYNPTPCDAPELRLGSIGGSEHTFNRYEPCAKPLERPLFQLTKFAPYFTVMWIFWKRMKPDKEAF
jgi:hypothetical protein